jgi:hypothetical protein
MTLPPRWAALATHAGGVAALAEALGVPERTLRSWGAGTREPSTFARKAVSEWARRRKLKDPWES